jgi:hypothetical protein
MTDKINTSGNPMRCGTGWAFGGFPRYGLTHRHRAMLQVPDGDISDIGDSRVSRLSISLMKLFLFHSSEGNMLLRTIDGLTSDTIKSYRSKLRRLWVSLQTLDPDQARIAVQKIAQLERQLGIKANDVPGPGRPRLFI